MGHLSSRPIFSRLPASAITALRSRSGSSATLAFPCGLGDFWCRVWERGVSGNGIYRGGRFPSKFSFNFGAPSFASWRGSRRLRRRRQPGRSWPLGRAPTASFSHALGRNCPDCLDSKLNFSWDILWAGKGPIQLY